MQRARFRRLVQRAIESLPPELAERMENVDIQVRNRPTADELGAAGIEPGAMLLGLYVGVPLTYRGHEYGGALPDRIMIYQESIELVGFSEADVVEQIRQTVLHEIAHHFGIDDDRLGELGMG
jgi:predicted Zn-dependent protease with MMP-like domain